MERLIYENEIDTNEEIKANKLKKPAFNVLNPKKTFISVDDALVYVGDNSTYSKKLITIFSFFYAIMSFIIMGWIIFIGESEYYCKTNDTDILYKSCSKKEACSLKHTINNTNNKRLNIINYFHLYCDKEYLLYWANLIFFFGILIGGILFPIISDAKGRKQIINFCCIIICAGFLTCVLSFNFKFWILGIFFVGLGFGGLENTIWVYVSEVSALNFKVNATSILNIIWSVAQILLAVISKYINHWKTIFIYVFLIPMVIFSILNFLYILESPRYLIIKKRYNEGRKIFKKISIINKRPLFKFKFYGEVNQKNKEYLKLDNAKTRVDFGRKNTVIIKNNNKFLTSFIIFGLIWFINRIIYLSSNILLSIESENFFFNFSLLGTAELFSGIISAKVKKSFERKNSMLFCLILSGSLCLFQSYLIFSDIINFIIKFLNALANNILILYTTEYFPTNIRSKSLSICLTSHKIGSLFLSLFFYIINITNFQKITGLSILIFTFALLLLWLKKNENIDIEEINDEISNLSYEMVSKNSFKIN